MHTVVRRIFLSSLHTEFISFYFVLIYFLEQLSSFVNLS